MRRLSPLLCLFSAIAFSQSSPPRYLISTAAGTGGLGHDGPATGATFDNPAGVTVDASGNVYITDYTGNQIFKVTPAGVIGVIADSSALGGFAGDGGSALAARVANPFGMAVDRAGNLYFADTGNHRVRRIDPDGNIATIAGSGSAGFTGDGAAATAARINGPWAVATDSAGNIYIADTGNSSVRKVNPAGIISTVAGTGVAGFSGDGAAATKAQLNGPTGVWADPAGNVYIADQNNRRIRKVTAAWMMNTITQGSLIRAVTGDAAGNLYVGDVGEHRVYKITPAGIPTVIAGSPLGAGFNGDDKPATTAQLNEPSAVVLDGAGNIYIADQYNRRIRRVTPDGVIHVIAGTFEGGDGGPAGLATMYYPSDLALDANGNLFIADSGTHVIRKVTPGGSITTVAGNGQRGFQGDGGIATAASFYAPDGVAADNAGSLYIGDTSNQRVRRVDSSGKVTTIAGTGTAGFAGDGSSSAALAQLNFVRGVAVDQAGGVYIADTSNNRIRKISGGKINTIAGTGVAGYDGDGKQATTAQLSAPTGVHVDRIGNVYVADANNNRVRRISPGGVITTVAGTGTAGAAGDGGPATSAQLRQPWRIVTDRTGNLYIADRSNHRVRMVTTDGVMRTIAGNGSSGATTGDGGLSTLAQLTQPASLAVDDSGNVFVAEPFNHRVRKLTPIRVSLDSLRHGATFLIGPVSPGEVVTITGSGLGPDDGVLQGSDEAGVTILGNTRVLFDGVPARILASQAAQVTAIVPYGAAGKPSTQVQVEFQGVASASVAIP